MAWEYYDLAGGARGDIGLLFPGFRAGGESVAVVSPHDDDGLLGAGYLIQAARSAGARVRVLVMCDGRAGYSRVEDKDGISARRKAEARAAYRHLGLGVEDLVWLDVPDFSAAHYLGWVLPGGGESIFARMVPLLRGWRVTRLVIPNGNREHIDHLAGHQAGVFFGPQAGDAVLADWGPRTEVKSALVYSVWADFPGEPGRALRADRAIVAPEGAEDKVMAALRLFESQKDVIAGLVEARAGRRRGGRAVELYQTIDPRPGLEYGPYWEKIGEIE